MSKHLWAASAMLILAMLACNLPSGGPGEATATPTSALPTQPAATPIPSATPLPTDTPLPTLTPTPTIPIAWPLDKGVNCRLGYGTEWVVVGALLVGQTATIQGKNADASWWYVVTPNDPGTPCWVAASVTLTAGNLAGLAVIPQAVASVTDAGLKLDPKSQSIPGCMGPPQPVEFKGTISTNGPTTVKWHFESEQGGSGSSHNLDFPAADTKNVSDSYGPPPGDGDFWVRLVITEPNNKTAEASYKIECP
jgi:hypothetical protein